MKRLLNKFYTLIWANTSQSLPTHSVEQLKAFNTRLLGYYGISDNAPYHEAISNFIMHLKHDVARIKPSELARCVKKAMANEVCYQLLQERREARYAASKPVLSVATEPQ